MLLQTELGPRPAGAIPPDRPDTTTRAPDVPMLVPVLGLAIFVASVIFFELGVSPLSLFG